MAQPDQPESHDDEAFLAAWAEAEARAAEFLRDHLADQRGEPPPAGVDGALATLAASRERADPALAWLAAAAAMTPADLVDPDTETLIDLLAASISMVDEPGLPPEDAAAVMSVEYPDWAALVPQLVRAGPGAAADADHLAALVVRVAPDDPDDDDLTAFAHAFEVILPAWEAIGVVDRDRRLTEAGAWLLPRAACVAWDSDFDDPQPYGPGHPAEPRWVAYLEEEPPELGPDEAAQASAASRHLAAGALDLADLTGRVTADLDRDLSPDDLQSLLFDLPDTFPLRDGRWVHLPSLVDGTVATHRLTADELDVGGLNLDPDLEHFTWWGGGDLPLAGGGTAGVRHRHGAPRPFLAGLVGPEGWLDGMSAGDLIAVRVEGGTLHVEQLDPDAVDEQAGDRTAARLAETIEALGGANAAGGPLDVPELLLETLARAPLTLARPQPPLGELLERAGFAVDDSAVRPIDEVGAEREAEPEDDEFLTDVYGLDDHGVLAHRAVLAAVDLVAAGGVDALDDGELGSLAPALADPHVADSVADRVADLGPRGVDALDALAATMADHLRRRDRAGPLYVRARCAEFAGRTEDGEALLTAALDADPAFPPALLEAAWYAEDRGDAQKGLNLLRRAGVDDDDVQAARLERWAQPAAAAKVGRNDPCPCGSGRKYKVCCQRRGGHPLAARAGWLLDKAGTYVQRPRQRPRLLGIVEARAGDAREPERVAAAIRDPLVGELALFEDDVLADFLDDRGVLLPADELELGRRWIGTRRGLYEVLDARPGDGLTLLDLRAGDRVDVTERLASEVLQPGEAVYARVLPAGATHILAGGIVRIPVQHRETLLAFLDTEPEATAQAAWVAALEAPPALATMEGEPMVHCEAVYELADVDATRAALTARYEPLDEDRWTEYVDVDGQPWARGVLELDGDQLRVVTNSTARLERFKTAIAELTPGARLVDETRRPAGELLPPGGFAGEGGADDDLPAEALAALEEQVVAYEQRWVDEPIPLLGGMTPRQARDDPTRRDQLLALLAEMDQVTSGLPAGARGMDPARIRRTLGLA